MNHFCFFFYDCVLKNGIGEMDEVNDAKKNWFNWEVSFILSVPVVPLVSTRKGIGK